MTLREIIIGNTKASPTNIKGRAEGKTFDELVESIKEKGVLVPVLARKMKEGKTGAQFFEVIAGNRRLEAARKAGLKFLPAYVVEMNDTEAREAQIVENLQREGIHPIDEGKQYRELIDQAKYEISSVAAKVAKSIPYVRQRLFLTNLTDKIADAYRKGKIQDGHAVLIAKLSGADQKKAYDEATSGWQLCSVKDLKEWIDEKIYSQLENQPWLKMPVGHQEEFIGKCVECEPNNTSLFGPVKEGACTNSKCWKRKMDKYIEYMAKEKKLAKVSNEYGYKTEKDVLGKDSYVMVAKKGKDRCESTHSAIIVLGSGIGSVIDICSNKKCQTHYIHGGQYELSPKEQIEAKEKRKEEKENAKKAKELREKRLTNALEKISLPLSAENLDALLDIAIEMSGQNTHRTVAKRHELVVEKTAVTEFGGGYRDYTKAIKGMTKEMKNGEKLKLVFELMIDTGYDSLRSGVGKIK